MPNEWDAPPPDDDDEEEMGPDHPDYDLSEAHGYTWEPKRGHWSVPPWVIAAISLLVVLGLVLPSILFVLRYG